VFGSEADARLLCSGPRLAALEAENVRLRTAAQKHYDQHADDLCVFDDNELYAAFGLLPRVPTVGDKAEMLRNCERFIERRCLAGGGWESYAELEARLAALDAACRAAAEVIGDGFLRSGGTDETSWDECGQCGRPDWQGHRPDCRMAELVKRLAAALAGGGAVEGGTWQP